MKKLTTLLFVAALILVIVGGYLYLDSRKEADKEKADAEATPEIVYISSVGVVKSIETKLGRLGRRVDAKCPKEFDGTPGSRFTCEVFYVGGKEPVATAQVKVTGLGGQYKWSSKPIKKTPTPSVTPTATPAP